VTNQRVEGYADALHAIAQAEGRDEVIEDELSRFARVVQGSDELRERLSDPMIPAATRQQIVVDLLGGKAEPTTISLASMVVANGRARELPAIVDAMIARRAREASKEVAEVRTAIELTEDQRARLASALTRATGKQVALSVIVDPSVKGGVVAQVGDTVIDGSVRRRLDQLRSSL
jgi:F-type H+-transporting ATPase subunit delta